MTGLGDTDIGPVVAWLIAASVLAGFVAVARHDARTQRVVVRHALLITALAVGGLGLLALATTDWWALATAAASAAAITAIQLVPYTIQQRRGSAAIGRADVRLAIPFGWTLGYFGLSYAFVGFAVALVAGLAFALATTRHRIPFVPFLAAGLATGLGWALVVAVATSG